MGRQRKGSIRRRGDRWFAVVTAPPDRRFERRIPDREDGHAITDAYARAFVEELQARCDRGEWSPDANEATPTTPTVLEFARRWIREQTYTSRDDDADMIERVLPHHEVGAMALGDVRPKHVRVFVRWLRTRESRTGRAMAPRTVRSTYNLVRRVFRDALADELIASSPCVLPRGALPSIVDADPEWRSGARFSPDEVAALTTDPRIPWRFRVTYGLLCYSGQRPGEAYALRWRDFDADARPLHRFIVARSVERRSRVIKGTKTGVPREVPVHPALAELLAAWRLRGWFETYGRHPTPDDLIVPATNLEPQRVNHASAHLLAHCKALGLRYRSPRTMRRTFVSIARDSGARMDVLRWVTHTPPKSMVDQYTTLDWRTLCEAVASIRVEVPRGQVVPLVVGDRGGDIVDESWTTSEEPRRIPVRATGFEPVTSSV